LWCGEHSPKEEADLPSGIGHHPTATASGHMNQPNKRLWETQPPPDPPARPTAPWIVPTAWAIDPTSPKELAAPRETLSSVTSKPPPWWRGKGSDRATGPGVTVGGQYGVVPFGAQHPLNPRAPEDQDVGPATAEALQWI
jgi:hypothetical protein